MDFEYKDQYQDLKLKKLPSEYWRNQCRATFQYDRVGTKLIEDMGVETLMWGSDFPHPDGVWPESKKYIDEQFAHLPADVDPQDDLRERRQVLRPDELGESGVRRGCRTPLLAGERYAYGPLRRSARHFEPASRLVGRLLNTRLWVTTATRPCTVPDKR